MTYEIVYSVDGVTSWMYFSPRKDPKAEGEKKFRQVCRDSGWKKTKIIKIHPLPKAVDPPLTKAQKEASRKPKTKPKIKRKQSVKKSKRG